MKAREGRCSRRHCRRCRRREEDGRAAAAPRGGRRAVALEHGAVVIAAITSCTNTSNPSVMIGAGLVAKKAVEKGLTPQAVGEDEPRARLEGRHRVSHKAGLTSYLDKLGFNLVGYGCTTCIGNSGPLPDDVLAEVEAKNLVVASVLSGNRNFEGRIQQAVRANYLASPPLVVAYALAGIDERRSDDRAARARGSDGKPVYLRDIWPTRARNPGGDARRR
ncbi:MAG: aconitase family protein [Vicinamibacterales bacterium]